MVKRIKCIALLLSLMLVLSALAGAVAESPEETALPEAYGDLNLSAEEAEWLDDTVNQDVVVDQMYNVDEFAVTEGLPDNWVNILLLGTDEKYSNQYGRTDSMVIMSVNLATRQAKLTSIMRDLWVTMADRSKSGKINTACAQGGPKLAMNTVNECFGMNIQYYALVNMSSMAEIIDMLGGLDLDVTLEEMNALNDGLFDLSPLSGMERLMEYGSDVHLNGNQATAFARIRKIDSDYQRTDRQRSVLVRLAERLQQEDASTIVGVVMKLLEHVETNMNITQLMTIAAVGLEINLDDITQLRIPAEGTYTSGTFTYEKKKVWCIKADFSENTKLLHAFIYGTN